MFTNEPRAFVLRNARVGNLDPEAPLSDLAIVGAKIAMPAAGAVELDVGGRLILPALVNAHDHLDASAFPALGHPPYASVYDWTEAVATAKEARAAFEVPLVDRLFLGGMRNLLSGFGAVAHHGVFHRSLARDEFPLWVLERYQFAHSPGLTAALRKTYRSTDRRIPWFAHVAEGVDARCGSELDVLVSANLMKHNCVIVHGVGLRPEDIPKLAAAQIAVVWSPESNRHLYGATAPVAALAAAGVRIGLGSDSPATGVRDGLSTLAAARREGVFSDAELVALSTTGAAAVARLPTTDLAAGSAADFIVVDSLERLLRGDRTAIAAVWRNGRIQYGDVGVVPQGVPVRVDGVVRALAAPLGERLHALLSRYPQVRLSSWAAGLGRP